MINVIVLYGTKQQLLEIELPDTSSYNDEQWMTNCFGVDIVAYCTDADVTFDEYKLLSDKFFKINFGFAHYDYLKEVKTVGRGWIAAISRDPKNPNNEGLLSDIGFGIVQSDSDFMYDIATKYSSLRSVPFDYHRPEENVYVVDLNKAGLRDLPVISSISTKMLNKLKSDPTDSIKSHGVPVSTLVFHNNDYSILIGQTAALHYLLSPITMKDALANCHIMNTTQKQPNVVYYELAASHLGLKLNNLGN